MKHFYSFLFIILGIGLGQSQTEIINQTLRSGSIPSGWTQTDVTFSTSAGGYARFDATTAVLTSELFDASSYSSIEVDFNVAKFGSGGDGPITLEYSTNDGSSWTTAGNSSIPTSSTYLSNNITISTLSSTMRIRFTRASSPSQKRLRDVVITGFGGATTTSVQFASNSASVLESVGTVDLTLTITNEDGSNATTCDVVIISGDAADVDSYTTQMVTFPAGSSADQTVTVTVTDDSIFEGDETISFEIQNVAGGSSAAAGTDDQFDLTIEDNDPDPSINVWCEPFDDDDQYTVTLGGEGNDGASDYFQRTDGTNISESYTGANGNFFAGQDLDDGGWTGSANPSQLTWSSIDISDFSSLNFKGSFASNGGGIDAADFVLVEYQIDAGGWNDLLAFENDGASSNTFFLEDTDFNGTGDGTALSTTFAQFTKTIGSTGSLLDLRITVSMNSGDEEVAFDDFKITGIFSGLTYSGGSWSPSAPDGSTGASDAIIVDGTAVFAADASLNDVSVYPGAALQVDTAVTLTASSVTLESESDSYSSLILDGTITGTVNYNRSVNSFTDDATNNDNDLISAPLTGQAFSLFDGANTNLLASTTVTTLRAFATFNNDTGAYDNFDTTTNAGTTLDAATGYRAATTDGGTLTFTGTVNTGDVDKNITIGTDATFSEWNLIGNPYPSYVDIQAFLEHEVTTGITNFDLLEAGSGIYGYDGDASDGWTVITLANDDGEFFAPGQGFFVAANGTGTLIADHDIEFRASMRAAGTSDDFIIGRNSSPLTFLKLNASTIDKNYRTEFYFNENASQGLDQGYDAKLWGGSAPEFALFSHLVQNNTGLPMALQALSDTDYNDVIIPLGVNANAGEELTFSISESTLPSDINVYLEDNVTNTFTLLNNGDYILTPLNTLNGTGRFYLRFSANVLSIDDRDLTDISVYNDGDRAIVIAGELLQPTTAKIFDLQGRVVMTRTLDMTSREQRIETNQFSSGVYIIQLNNEVQSISQKIIIR